MFRLSRLLLWRGKEFGKGQNIYRSATSGQNVAEVINTKNQAAENILQNDVKNKHRPSPTNSTADLIQLYETKRYRTPSGISQSALELSKLISDEEAFEYSMSMSFDKIIEVMKFLTYTNNRPIKLLRVFSDRILQNQEQLTLKQCADLMYCLGKFSFKNVAILNRLADDIHAGENEFGLGILPASIIQSCGMLKYRNCSLLDLLLQKIVQYQHPKRNKSLLTALKTLASVNYFPPIAMTILKELSAYSATDHHETKMFIDFVWACTILNHLSEEHISVVLSETFINQLKVAEGYFGSTEPLNMKLLNIQAAATCFLPSFQNHRRLNLQCQNKMSKSKAQFMESVIDGLSHIFPKNGYLKLRVDTKAGFNLDIECYMNSKGSPIPLGNVKDHKKIGIMLLNFNDLCLCEERIECGMVAFKQRILEAQGYTVVKVIESDYNNNFKLFEKVYYLRKNLETAYKISEK